jgi:anti-anti-sigma regulatory factor
MASKMEGYKILKLQMEDLKKPKALLEMLTSEAESSKDDLVVDMGNISCIYTGSLSDIISAYSRMKKKGEENRLILTNMQEPVEDTMVRILKMDSLLKIFKTNEDYLRQRKKNS